MKSKLNSSEILDREYLEMRAKILELAASLDRIDRADGDVDDEQKLVTIQKGIEILSGSQNERAKSVQQLFSRDYHENWAEEYQMETQS